MGRGRDVISEQFLLKIEQISNNQDETMKRIQFWPKDHLVQEAVGLKVQLTALVLKRGVL